MGRRAIENRARMRGKFSQRWLVLRSLLYVALAFAGLSAVFAQTETWTSGDVGSPALAGTSSYNAANDTFTVTGAGADIWGTADQFQFVYQAVSGNCELVARVITLQNTDGWAKAGLMLREDLTTGAKNALVVATASNGVTSQWRYTAGAASGFAAGGSGAAPVWVKLKRLGDQVTYYRSADGQTWTQIGTQNVAMNSTVYAGLVVTSHNPAALATATFDHVSVTASGTGTLPSPWNDADIGSVGYRGYAVFDGTSTFSVAGGGADIWGTADAFHFLYQPLVGDGAVQARVLSQQNTNAWAKAGGMIRESLDPGSKHGMSMFSSVYGMFFQSRNTTGGSTMGLPALGGTAPIWTKVERRGPVIIGWKSLDGTTWDWVGSQPVSMATQAYAGLAVNAHNNAALSLATFDNLQVTAGRENELPTPWNELMLGAPVLGGWAGYANNTFTLYAGGGDTWGAADQGEFVYRPLNGDGTITLKVANLKNSQEWAKAGVMMRETLSPNAKHILWAVSPSHGVTLQKRVTTGATPTCYYDSVTVAPVWLKLQRTGNIFTASKSSDGVTWNVFGTETVPMDANIYAGAILSSLNSTVIGQADIQTLTMAAPSAHNFTPLAWWAMNEGSGTTLVDSTSGHHDATVSGTLVWTSGHDGAGGISLPSGDATAFVTTQTLMPGTSSLTVSAWFKTTDSGVRRIISKGHWGATTGFLLGIGHSAPGRLTFGIGGGTAAESVLISTTESFNNGAWHHVVGVYDSAAHTARIYVDGTLRNVALTGSIWGGTVIENGKALDTSALTQLSTTSNIALHIGSYNGQYERWIGELDDVQLYAAALDDLAVQNLYASGDGDGLPDSWEQRIVDFSSTDNITSIADVLPDDDFDGDGLTDLQEYEQGSDPTDYYNGQLPSITILSGNNQQAASGALVADPVIVKVTNASGEILVNAPVQFNANTSGAGISATATGNQLTFQNLRTGADGTASVYPAPSGEKGSTSTFQAAASSGNQAQSASFTAVVGVGKVTPQIAGGGYKNGVMLKGDGTVWAWGMYLIGDASDSDPQPVYIATTADESVFSDVQAIDVGAYHAVALKNDGTVWTWGRNYRGELGDGNQVSTRMKPDRVLGLNETAANPVIAIAAGSYYSVALKQDRTVWQWGTGLGLHESDHLIATQVKMADGTNLTDVIAIAAEGYHVLVVKSDHTVWAWGQNTYGELGNDTTTITSTPVQVLHDGIPLTDIDEVGAGNGFSMALNKSTGTMWAWGANGNNQLGNGNTTNLHQAEQMSGFDASNPPAALACGFNHTLALTADRSVWAWGNNLKGVLGDGNATQWGWTPSFAARVSTLSNIVAIGAGADNSYAIDSLGRLWSWGELWNWWNSTLAQEPKWDSTTPAIVTTDQNGFPFGNVKEVGATSNGPVTVALKDDGTLWTSGLVDSAGCLGDGTGLNAPFFKQITGVENIQHISAGSVFGIALDGTGQVWGWGLVRFPSPSFIPVKVKTNSGSNLGNTIAIAAGTEHGLAIDGNHNVWAWGMNVNGSVGNGTGSVVPDAVQITTDSQGNPFGNIVKIAGGNTLSLAIDTNDHVWTWGGGNTRPVQMAGLSNIVAISVYDHQLALDNEGRVWAWGANNYGQLGAGTSDTSSSTPVQVPGLGTDSLVVEICAGRTFSAIRKANGTVWAWGQIPSQYTGLSNAIITTPLEITALGNVSKLIVCANEIFAVHADGSLATFGQSGNGLGYGSTKGGPLPLLVGGINVLSDSPQAAITSPATSSSVALGTPVSLQASASGGPIGKVDFYNEGAWIGSTTSGSFLWQPPTWGTYHIHAVVTNPEGFKSAYSNVITLLVPYAAPTPPPDPGGPGDDTDGDGVTDTQEIIAGTDPFQKDNPSLNLNVNVILK